MNEIQQNTIDKWTGMITAAKHDSINTNRAQARLARFILICERENRLPEPIQRYNQIAIRVRHLNIQAQLCEGSFATGAVDQLEELIDQLEPAPALEVA